MKPQDKVKVEWSPEFAYALGLIATDGCLSKDRRHFDFTSKDLELVLLFKRCLRLGNKIGKKARGGSKDKKYYRIQFGSVIFYKFLLSLGFSPAKSKTLNSIDIPDLYFSHFFRGCFDGDGNISIQKHPESQHPQLRVRIFSASPLFLEWLRERNARSLKLIGGYVDYFNYTRSAVLSYGKADSIKILNWIYGDAEDIFLSRKYQSAKPFLNV